MPTFYHPNTPHLTHTIHPPSSTTQIPQWRTQKSFTYLKPAHYHRIYTQIYLLETQFVLNRLNYRAEMKFRVVLDTMYKKV